MTEKEIFPNPTVKQVIFQIKFPNLFSIEAKIGDIQEKIMGEFPKSHIAIRRKFILTEDEAAKLSKSDNDENVSPGFASKIWNFSTEAGVELNIMQDSLGLASEKHKTYNNPSTDLKFRNVISFVLKSFFEVIKISKINRIGLRYIDDCPIPEEKTAEAFRKYYNTCLNLDRFPLDTTSGAHYGVTVKRNSHYVTYQETLKEEEKEGKKRLTYSLDFDGFARDIASDKCMEVTDALHNIISDEFFKTIQEPVKKHMRKIPGA